jgi:hypothetical protein
LPDRRQAFVTFNKAGKMLNKRMLAAPLGALAIALFALTPALAAPSPYNEIVQRKLNEAMHARKLTTQEKRMLSRLRNEWYGFTVDSSGWGHVSADLSFRYPPTIKALVSSLHVPAPPDGQTQDFVCQLSLSGVFDVDYED